MVKILQCGPNKCEKSYQQSKWVTFGTTKCEKSKFYLMTVFHLSGFPKLAVRKGGRIMIFRYLNKFRASNHFILGWCNGLNTGCLNFKCQTKRENSKHNHHIWTWNKAFDSNLIWFWDGRSGTPGRGSKPLGKYLKMLTLGRPGHCSDWCTALLL